MFAGYATAFGGLEVGRGTNGYQGHRLVNGDRQKIREILETGEFSTLSGAFESETLECKRQPYRFDTDAQKLELARDVSVLANARGGTILIGFVATSDDAHQEDRIRSVRPFSESLINKTQYLQVLESWLYPWLTACHPGRLGLANGRQKARAAPEAARLGR